MFVAGLVPRNSFECSLRFIELKGYVSNGEGGRSMSSDKMLDYDISFLLIKLRSFVLACARSIFTWLRPNN